MSWNVHDLSRDSTAPCMFRRESLITSMVINLHQFLLNYCNQETLSFLHKREKIRICLKSMLTKWKSSNIFAFFFFYLADLVFLELKDKNKFNVEILNKIPVVAFLFIYFINRYDDHTQEGRLSHCITYVIHYIVLHVSEVYQQTCTIPISLRKSYGRISHLYFPLWWIFSHLQVSIDKTMCDPK